MQLKIISAGAGSGKTFRLMTEMVSLLQSGEVQPEGIIATTFTKKAAIELEERVRVRLLEEGLPDLANRLTGALIGTVHGLGVKLLKRFCFEAGVSPSVDIIADEDQHLLFNQSLANILTEERVQKIETLVEKLSLRTSSYGSRSYDWREDVKAIVDRARANGFDSEKLRESRQRSITSLAQFFPQPAQQGADYFQLRLETLLQNTLEQLQNNEADTTQHTRKSIEKITKTLHRLRQKETLSWSDWAALSKLKIGAKSRDIIEELQDFCRDHDQHPHILADIQAFIHAIFDTAIDALEEYAAFKQKRGLIDYLDMETQVKKLLDHPDVSQVLQDEIDLLMVDEFQDTSPIQLEIFWKLSRMANHSIWVGDPKQSIYGFRGAEPELMQAIIDKNGGIRAEDIQRHSWRSREDLVYATNAIFCKAFTSLPQERIALDPKRRTHASTDSLNDKDEPIEMDTALMHWHYDHEGKRTPGRPWMERCIASSIRKYLERQPYINDGKDHYRPARAGDVAVLCRSNHQCLVMAEALHHQGLKASISRNGLLETPEARLVLACLKYLMNAKDSLSVAEIVFLASAKNLDQIIDSRIEWMEQREQTGERFIAWEKENPYIQRLDELRAETTELSAAEIINLILEDLDLRRIIMAWGTPHHRCDNVDMLRLFADRYEDACNRLHTGASLGGFLLWLNDLASKQLDAQGSSEQADAVNVLTYHRSKGLEWPVVVLHDLENKLRDNLWGAQVVSDNNEVDLDQLSANRYIRFWRHPYGLQYRRTLLEERIDNSPVKQESLRQAVEEEARLLYVGITRARDYLVFTSRPKPTLWLNRTWQGQEEEGVATLDPNSYQSPWEWAGKELPIVSEVELMPRALEHHPQSQEHIYAQQARKGQFPSATPALIHFEQREFTSDYKWQNGPQTQIGVAFPNYDDVQPFIMAKAIQAFLDFDLPQYSPGQRMAAAERILERFELKEAISYMEMVNHAEQFRNWVQTNLSPLQWHKQFPIHLKKGGRYFHTAIDLLLENRDSLIVIQHTSANDNHKKWKQKAAELSDWYYLVHWALQQQYPKKKIRMFLHFCLAAGLQEVSVVHKGQLSLG